MKRGSRFGCEGLVSSGGSALFGGTHAGSHRISRCSASEAVPGTVRLEQKRMHHVEVGQDPHPCASVGPECAFIVQGRLLAFQC